ITSKKTPFDLPSHHAYHWTNDLWLNGCAARHWVKQPGRNKTCTGSPDDSCRRSPSVCLVPARHRASFGTDGYGNSVLICTATFDNRAFHGTGAGAIRAGFDTPQQGSDTEDHPELSNSGGFQQKHCADDGEGEMASGV